MATLLEQIANIQTLIDNLEALAFGDENTSATHNGQTRDSLSKAIKGKFDALQAMVQGRLAYETKAAMDAAGAPPAGELAEVVGDSETGNNGLYYWSGSAWVKSGYDPMGYVDSSLSQTVFAPAPWSTITPIINDVNNDDIKRFIGGDLVSSPIGWPDGVSCVELVSTEGDSTLSSKSIRDEAGNKIKLSDFPGQYIDVCVLAEYSGVHSEESSDFITFGILLNNDTQYPSIQAYYSRQIRGDLAEYRGTVSVDDILAVYPNAEIVDLRCQFKQAVSGVIRFGSVRAAIGPSKDRSFFDAHYAQLVSDTDLYKLDIDASTRIDALYMDIEGSDLSSATAVNSDVFGIITPGLAWPNRVENVVHVESSGAETVTLTMPILVDGNQISVGEYASRNLNINFTYIIETDLDLKTDFYRTGLLLNVSGEIKVVKMTGYKLIREGIYIVYGITAIDEVLSGSSDAHIVSLSPQIKPGSIGYVNISALRVGIGDTDRQFDFSSTYNDRYTNTQKTEFKTLKSSLESVEATANQASNDAAAAVAATGVNVHKKRLKEAICASLVKIENQVTSTVGNDQSSIPGSHTVSANDSALKYLFGRKVYPVGSQYPKSSLSGTRSLTYATDTDLQYDTSANIWGVEFNYTGQYVEIGLAQNPNTRNIFIEVDGVITPDSPVQISTGSNTKQYLKLSFVDWRTRRIRLISTGGTFVWDVRRESTGIVSPYVDHIDCLGVVMGDSFTEGSAATESVFKYGYRIGKKLNINNIVLSGSGGTGYLKTIPHHSGGERLNALQRIDDVLDPIGTGRVPDFILFCYGINDAALPVADVASNARACFDYIRSISINIPIIVCGPFTSTEASYNHTLAAAIEAEVDAIPNAYYIDNSEWITGSGRVDNQVGDGVADLTQSEDQTHPSDAGHEYYADMISTAIKSIVRDW